MQIYFWKDMFNDGQNENYIFHKELKTKNAETNKFFSQLSALLVLVMGNIKKELKKTAHRRLWIVLTK